MKVRMKVGISGTRSGVDWPPPGGELIVDDDEGMHLCAGGLAEPVAELEKAEIAVAPQPEVRDESPRRTAKKAT